MISNECSHLITYFQQRIVDLQHKVDLDVIYIKSLESEVEKQKDHINTFANMVTDNALEILSNKFYKQLHFQNLPPVRPFLTVSIDWVQGFEHFMQQLPYGRIVQPLPSFRPSSKKWIREITNLEDLEKLFPEKLERTFNGGSRAKLGVPSTSFGQKKPKSFPQNSSTQHICQMVNSFLYLPSNSEFHSPSRSSIDNDKKFSNLCHQEEDLKARFVEIINPMFHLHQVCGSN